MDALKNQLGISKNVQKLTASVQKETEYTRFNDQAPQAIGWNYMGDTLHLPATKKGYKYLLVVCDLAEKTFDIEPMKEVTDKCALSAYKKMFKRTFIQLPAYTFSSDSGNEFKGVFDKFLKKNKIYHKVGAGGRHKQQGPIEALNRVLASLFNGYMNQKEEDTHKVYREWTDKLVVIRTELNKIREKQNEKEGKDFNPFHQISKPAIPLRRPKFEIGDEVLVKNEKPKNALGRNQSTEKWRTGDYYFNPKVREITHVLEFSGDVPYRYLVQGLNKASYTEKELRKA